MPDADRETRLQDPGSLFPWTPSTDGRPLPPRTRRAMEALFQTDFSGIRVHLGPETGAHGVLAFAFGSDLHFASRCYRPGTARGLRLIAHELTHVVQQRQGRVPIPPCAAVAVVVDDPALEAEAEAMGARAARLIRRIRRFGASAVGAQSSFPAAPFGRVIQCYRIVKTLGVDHQEVQFSRSEKQPKKGHYNDDGYYYAEIASTSTALIYERTKKVPEVGDEEEDVAEEPITYPLLENQRHLRAKEKKIEGAFFRKYYQLSDQELVSLYALRVDLLNEIKNRKIGVDTGIKLPKLEKLWNRLALLERRRTRSAIAELKAFVGKYVAKQELNPKFRILSVADDAASVTNVFKADSMPYKPAPDLLKILSLDPPKPPKIHEKVKAIESRFDVLARKSGAPPKALHFTETVKDENVHEVDLAGLPTQGGLPIDWVKVLVDSDGQLPMIVTINSARSEKAMAIGFQGAIDFGGELTVGGNKATRIYGLVLPKGSINILGVKMRDQDSPNRNVFKTISRKGNTEKIFSIRYEESTKKDGQVHLHDDWLLELADESFISQTEYLRSISYGLVELTFGTGEWTVRAFTPSSK